MLTVLISVLLQVITQRTFAGIGFRAETTQIFLVLLTVHSDNVLMLSILVFAFFQTNFTSFSVSPCQSFLSLLVI